MVRLSPSKLNLKQSEGGHPWMLLKHDEGDVVAVLSSR